MFILRNTIQRLFPNQLSCTSQITSTLGVNSNQIRTKVIDYNPKPTETKRFRKVGFLTRVKTPSGRKLMMEKILKGDKCIGH